MVRPIGVVGGVGVVGGGGVVGRAGARHSGALGSAGAYGTGGACGTAGAYGTAGTRHAGTRWTTRPVHPRGRRVLALMGRLLTGSTPRIVGAFPVSAGIITRRAGH